MLGTFTGVMVAVVSAREAGWLKTVPRRHPCPPARTSPARSSSTSSSRSASSIVMMAISALVYGLHLRLVAMVAMLCYTMLGVFCFTAIALAVSRLITTAEMGSSVGPFVTITLELHQRRLPSTDLMPHWLVSTSRTTYPSSRWPNRCRRPSPHPGTGFILRTFIALGIWGVVAFVVARWTFTWQPLRR